ncbi:hypothetical protein [Cyanothece sp. BG0011]|uniref:hypothetical protein n=1 Tax=Cyanothece sp. BG0011 TaxID=2082950 RepID=UPI000D1E83B9|nr:hypothetical protein [Cyanothece sp. BG0011]
MITDKHDDNDNNRLPLIWKKLQVVSQLLSSVLIPVAIGVAGLIINRGLATEELNLKYIDLATDILNEEKINEKEELRDWAVEIINFHIDEALKMSKQIKKEFSDFYLGSVIQQNPERTDFDLFVCQENQKAGDEIAAHLWKTFKTWQKGYGSLGYYLWDNEELSFDEIKGKATIILDKDHPEKEEVKSLKTFLKSADNNLEIQTIDNTGEPTPWRISIIVCP